MRAIMDALSPGNAARRIVFMKAAQVGATEAGNNWIGYVIHHAPGPMLAVQPQSSCACASCVHLLALELAKRFSRQRIDPLIAESPVLRERVKPQRSRDAGNTVLSKEFPAGLLVITGANSAVGLRFMQSSLRRLHRLVCGALSVSRRGRCLSAIRRRGRRSGRARGGSHAHVLLALEGILSYTPQKVAGCVLLAIH
jgi:hypothetical protein